MNGRAYGFFYDNLVLLLGYNKCLHKEASTSARKIVIVRRASAMIQEDLLKEGSETQVFLLAEYNTLREEILQRIQAQDKIISLTLLVFGTILSFGLQNRLPSVILLYPIIATFLASIWAHHTISIKIIAHHIKDEIECKIKKKNIGWENRRSTPYQRLLTIFVSVSVYGVFLGTPIAAIFVAKPIFFAQFSLTEIFLLILAFLCVICSGIIIALAKPRHT